MDWTDIQITVRFILAHDKHCYYDERLLVQTIWLFLLIADGGERSGAITQSESYRHGRTMLRYRVSTPINERPRQCSEADGVVQDVKVFMRPAASKSPSAAPEFRLEIRYNNRKGKRRDEEKL